MFVLLQVSPPEAAGHEDWCCCLDVIAVDASEAALRQYLAVYEPRDRAAVAAFDLWDADLAKDWGAEHDRVHDEFLVKYDVHGSLIQGTRFEIRDPGKPDQQPARSGAGSVDLWLRKPLPSDSDAWRTPRRGERGKSAEPRSIRSRAAMFYFLPRPALAYCRTPFSKSTRQPWRPARLGGGNISATLHHFREAPPQPGDEQVGGWSHAQLIRMDNRFRARLLRAFKRGRRTAAGLRPRRTRQRVAASAPNPSPPCARRPT